MTTSAPDAARWIRCFHSVPPEAIQLWCFPHAGGSASFYHPLSAALSPLVELVATQYPGRQDRRFEPLLRQMSALAEQSCAALAGRLRQPFALFGHSLGAIAAYEVARKLEAAGGPAPMVLIVSGRRAPSRYRDEAVHLRDDAGLLDEVRMLGGTDVRVFADEELRELVIPVLRADYQVIESYRWIPGPPLRCPILAMVGDADSKTTVDEARAWREHTTGGFELRVFSGGHFYLVDRRTEVVRVVSETLSSYRSTQPQEKGRRVVVVE